MNKKDNSENPDRRKFLIQLGGSTLAVGFGVGLTSCEVNINIESGSTVNIGSNNDVEANIKGVRTENSGNNNGNNNGNGGGHNNSNPLIVTYEPLTDTYHYENTGDEDVLVLSFDLNELNGEPMSCARQEVYVSPGQTYSLKVTSETSGVLTNTSSSNIYIGEFIVAAPNETFDFG